MNTEQAHSPDGTPPPGWKLSSTIKERGRPLTCEDILAQSSESELLEMGVRRFFWRGGYHIVDLPPRLRDCPDSEL